MHTEQKLLQTTFVKQHHVETRIEWMGNALTNISLNWQHKLRCKINLRTERDFFFFFFKPWVILIAIETLLYPSVISID